MFFWETRTVRAPYSLPKNNLLRHFPPNRSPPVGLNTRHGAPTSSACEITRIPLRGATSGARDETPRRRRAMGSTGVAFFLWGRVLSFGGARTYAAGASVRSISLQRGGPSKDDKALPAPVCGRARQRVAASWPRIVAPVAFQVELSAQHLSTFPQHDVFPFSRWSLSFAPHSP